MMDRANEFADIHAGLSSLTSDGWEGRTADHFRYKFNLQIKGWLDAQIAFSDASTAYQSYASTLLSAQSQCDEIRSRWEQGRNAVEQAQNNKADARSRAAAEGGTPMFDASCDEGPGRSTMAAAEDDFQTLVNQVNESATLLINALNSGISKLPERTWMDAVTRTLKSVYDGFLEATIDLIKLTWTLGGYAALYDFGRFICGDMTFDELHAKWVELPAETFVGLTTVLSENPEAFFEGLAKGLFDYDTLIDDPGRAFGHAIPDILITIATAGAGTGASAGSKGATRASKAVRIGRAVFKELTHISDIEDIAHLSKLAFRKIKRIGVHAVTSLSDIAENAAERLRRLKEAGHTGHPPLSGAPDNSPHIPSSGTSSSSSHGGLSTPAQGSHPAAGNTHTPSPAGPDSGADHGGSHQAGQGSNGHSGASSSHAATNTGGGAPNSEPPIPAPPKSEAPTTHSLSDTTQAPHARADIADGKPRAADPTTPTHEADGSTDGSTGYKYREKYGSPESDASSHTTNPDGDGDKNPHHNLFNGNESSHSHHSAAGEHTDADPKAKDHSANGKADDAADSTRHGDKTEADKPTSNKSHKEDDAAHHDGDSKSPKDEADTHKSDKDSDGKSDKDSVERKDADPTAKDHSSNGKANDAADSARHGDKTEADKPRSDKSHKEDDAAHHDGDEHPKNPDDKHSAKNDDADAKTTKDEADTHKSDKDTDAKSDKDSAEHTDAELKAKDHSANGKADDAADSTRHDDKTEADKPTSDKSHKEDDAAHHDGDEHPKDTDDKHTTKNDDADTKTDKDEADTHKSDKDADGKSDKDDANDDSDKDDANDDSDKNKEYEDQHDHSQDGKHDPSYDPDSDPHSHPDPDIDTPPDPSIDQTEPFPEGVDPLTTPVKTRRQLEQALEAWSGYRPGTSYKNRWRWDSGRTGLDDVVNPQTALGYNPDGSHRSLKQYIDVYDPDGEGPLWPRDVKGYRKNGALLDENYHEYTSTQPFIDSYGSGLCRLGDPGGKYAAALHKDGSIPSLAERGLYAPYSLGSPDMRAHLTGHLPEGYIAKHGTVAPAFGQPGGAIQLQIWKRDKISGKLKEVTLEEWEDLGIIRYDYQKYTDDK